MVALDHRMAAAAVHEEDDDLPVEDRLVLGQPPVDEHRLDAGDLCQALGQQLAAGVELVFAGAVAGPAGDQDDLGVSAAAGRETFASDQARRSAREASSFLIEESPLHAVSAAHCEREQERCPEPERPRPPVARSTPGRGCDDRQINSVWPGRARRAGDGGPFERVLGKVSSFELSACSQVTALPV